MHRSPSRLNRAAQVLLVPLLATLAIAPGAVAQSDEPAASQNVELTVGLGFIPNVQFAQFYLADRAGYYADAGLDVAFQYKFDHDLITLLGQGAVDIGIADGTSLIPAVSQGIPVRYAATIYGRFPNVVFAPSSTGIRETSDLKGRRIGTPSQGGSSWVMLQALLATADLGLGDIETVFYPDFGQAVAVSEGQVDAATGFANNEPLQLRRNGIEVEVLRIDDVAPLPGNGLVVGETTLAEKSDALRAFTVATLRAMEEISADPQIGLEATFSEVPELAADRDTQLAILEATVDMWNSEHSAANGLGSVDRATWQSALEIMAALPDSVVDPSLSVEDLVTDELQP